MTFHSREAGRSRPNQALDIYRLKLSHPSRYFSNFDLFFCVSGNNFKDRNR